MIGETRLQDLIHRQVAIVKSDAPYTFRVSYSNAFDSLFSRFRRRNERDLNMIRKLLFLLPWSHDQGQLSNDQQVKSH